MYADRSLPETSYDELEIRAADGTSVRAYAVEPEATPTATIVLVPVVKALATDLARRGYRVVSFTGREHWNVVLDAVRERADGHAVIALGPSELVINANADALVFLGGRVWRGLRATLTTAVRVPVAQVLGRIDLPLARLALGPTHIVRSEASGERAYGAIAEAIEWEIRQARP